MVENTPKTLSEMSFNVVYPLQGGYCADTDSGSSTMTLPPQKLVSNTLDPPQASPMVPNHFAKVTIHVIYVGLHRTHELHQQY